LSDTQMHSVWAHTHYKIFFNNEKEIDNKMI